MEVYKEVLANNKELLEKLQYLHNKKLNLNEMIKSNQDSSPYIVEMSGLPRTGKTESFNKVFQFFKNGGLKIEKLEEPAYLIKSTLTFDEIRNISNLDFNDKTLQISRENLEKGFLKNPNIIFMDRGIIDNYFWYQKMFDDNEIDLDIYNDRMNSLICDFNKIDQLYIMSANPSTIIYRDYVNQLYLENRNKTTLENVVKLKKSIDKLTKRIVEMSSGKVYSIDTDYMSVMDTSIQVADTIMDGMIKKLNLK